MRETLFRGKMDDNSRWVEGYYCQAFRWTGDKEPVPAIQEADCFMFRSVDLSTVGQYTGLRDQNGKRIFEGDIVKFENEVFVMEYVSGFAAFSLHHPTNMRQAPPITPITVERMEIIGNIHDNPELIRATGSDIGDAAQDVMMPAT